MACDTEVASKGHPVGLLALTAVSPNSHHPVIHQGERCSLQDQLVSARFSEFLFLCNLHWLFTMGRGWQQFAEDGAWLQQQTSLGLAISIFFSDKPRKRFFYSVQFIAHNLDLSCLVCKGVLT